MVLIALSWGCFHRKIAEVAFMAGVALIAEVAFMAGVAFIAEVAFMAEVALIADIAFKAEVAIKVWVTSGGISIPFTH